MTRARVNLRLIPKFEPAFANGLCHVDEWAGGLVRQERGDALAQAFVAEGHEERRQQGDTELFGALLNGADHRRVARSERQHLAFEVLIGKRLKHVAGFDRTGGQPVHHEVGRTRVKRRAELGSLHAFLDDEAELA